ncbi:Phosphoribosylamine--glycine ligase [Paenibacillus sp. P1XP2]|nr:Phosphoribosylamine--glycine ligase [Paenibacillus sp. P1XP2]
MDILVIGGGGREHAIVWALRKSPKAGTIYCAPGNAGIGQIAECVPIAVHEFDKLTAFAADKNVGLVVVGPDDPLADASSMRLKRKTFRCSDRAKTRRKSKAAKRS